MEIEEVSCKYEALPLLSLNHVSVLCKSVSASVRFYEQVLGFVAIKRPSSFDFNGAWLYNYGIGIHLIENPQVLLDESTTTSSSTRRIDPKDNHISFECSDVGLVKKRLEEMGMRYVSAVVKEEGKKVDQVFFHDPDGYMVEICDCQNIPVVPLSSSSLIFKKTSNCRFMENLMMENLSLDMINISF